MNGENPGRNVRPSIDSSLHDREDLGGTLRGVFKSRFEVLNADTPELIRQAQKIRYQVYCVEKALENPLDNREGIESDEFDSHALHSLLFARATAAALGTVRLILPLANAPEKSFAMQRLLSANALKLLLSMPLHSMAEVSRFSISRYLRGLTLYSVASPEAYHADCNAGPLIRLGLIQGLVRMSMQHGINYWCALMEPTLLRMLAAMAIRFQPIGPLVEFRGRRQPCYIDVYAMLVALMRERPAFWEIVTDGGALSACMAAA
jgi:N-acyl amino acid synthase of PEP-CTERM/exosortase system